MVDLARKNLLHDRIRFLITVLGVAFSVTLVLVQVGLFLGLTSFATITIDRMPADLWVVNRATRNLDFAVRFPENYVERVRGVPGVERADNLFVTLGDVRLPSGAQDGIFIYALEDFRGWSFPWEIEEGNTDDLHSGPFFLVDESVDHRYGRRVNVGEWYEVTSTRLQVVGRTREAKSFTTTPLAFMDYQRVQEMYPAWRGLTSFILVRLLPGVDVERTRAAIQDRLPLNEVLTSKEWAARTRGFWVKSTGLGFNMFVGVLFGCLIAVVIVAQTLYSSTVEHLREFGVVKAMGGSNWDIYAIISRQAVISALVGFLVGVAPSFLVRHYVQQAGLRVLFTPALTVTVFLGTVGLCLLASLISFRKVAKIDPALVFRS